MSKNVSTTVKPFTNQKHFDKMVGKLKSASDINMEATCMAAVAWKLTADYRAPVMDELPLMGKRIGELRASMGAVAMGEQPKTVIPKEEAIFTLQTLYFNLLTGKTTTMGTWDNLHEFVDKATGGDTRAMAMITMIIELVPLLARYTQACAGREEAMIAILNMLANMQPSLDGASVGVGETEEKGDELELAPLIPVDEPVVVLTLDNPLELEPVVAAPEGPTVRNNDWWSVDEEGYPELKVDWKLLDKLQKDWWSKLYMLWENGEDLDLNTITLDPLEF